MVAAIGYWRDSMWFPELLWLTPPDSSEKTMTTQSAEIQVTSKHEIVLLGVAMSSD